MAEAFQIAFLCTARILAYAVGGIAAVAVYAVVTAIFLLAAGFAFDRITEHMAKCWRKRNKTPKSKIAKIILEHDHAV